MNYAILGYVLDIQSRPIDEAIITDELSSSSSKSYKNGSYNLPVGEGKFYFLEYIIYVYLYGFCVNFKILSDKEEAHD